MVVGPSVQQHGSVVLPKEQKELGEGRDPVSETAGKMSWMRWSKTRTTKEVRRENEGE